MMKRIFGLILAFSVIFAMSCAKEECKAHSFGDWKVSVASTCTTEGTECRVCELCGESEERKIALVAHTYGDWQVEKAATCTDDGTEKRYCGDCEEFEIRMVSAVGHKFNSWKITSLAGCLTEGQMARSCDNCDLTETKNISATGHSFGTWKTVTVLTCTQDGVEKRQCLHCDETESRTQKAEGHEYLMKMPSVCSKCRAYTNDPSEFRKKYRMNNGEKISLTSFKIEESGDNYIYKISYVEERHLVYGILNPLSMGRFRLVFKDGVSWSNPEVTYSYANGRTVKVKCQWVVPKDKEFYSLEYTEAARMPVVDTSGLSEEEAKKKREEALKNQPDVILLYWQTESD